MRISEVARKFVVFFGAPSPKTGDVEYGGTGFLVLYREEGVTVPYLVTARHVAERVQPDSGIIIRVNTKDGGSVPFHVDDVVWAYHPDKNVDVAATRAYLDPKDWDVGYYELLDCVKRVDAPFRVQCGDPISIVGLFRLHSGSTRNSPIAHSGNIALLPDPHELIPVKDRNSGELLHMEAYLVEAQTLEGLSGAPVFQRELIALRQFGEHNGGPVIAMTGAQLLGVYSSAWDGEPSAAIVEDRKFSPNKRIPVGMGIVVPSERILELVKDHPDLKKHRAEIREKTAAENAAVTDSDLPATDANPNHREDFNSLVGAAARKRSQAG